MFSHGRSAFLLLEEQMLDSLQRAARRSEQSWLKRLSPDPEAESQAPETAAIGSGGWEPRFLCGGSSRFG